MTFWKRQNCDDSKKDLWLPEACVGTGMDRWSTEDFKGCGAILYDTIMVATSHHSFVKTHRMYNTIREP